MVRSLDKVEVDVEAMDKAGNFIGWLFVDNTNLSISLVEVKTLVFLSPLGTLRTEPPFAFLIEDEKRRLSPGLEINARKLAKCE